MSAAWHRRRSRGFTLIELLAVLGIVALLAAVLPAIMPSRIEALRTKAAAREVVSFLKQVRQEAVLSQRQVQIEIDPQRRVLSWGKRIATLSLPAAAQLSYLPAEAGRPADSLSKLTFYADGSASGGTLSLSNGTAAYRVDVDWLTGHVSILP